MRKLTIYKILIGSLLAFLLSFMLINFIYKSIFDEHWNERDEAIEKAYEQTELVKASDAELFSYEQAFTIVYGEDSEDKELIVWVGEEDIHSEYATDGVNKNLLKLKMKEKQPDIEIIKMTPGKYKADWCWEVLYEKEIDGLKHTYYGYYRFSDGEPLTTLRMSVER